MSLCCELGYDEEYRQLLAQDWLAEGGNSGSSSALRTARARMKLTNVLLDHGHISYEAQLAFVK